MDDAAVVLIGRASHELGAGRLARCSGLVLALLRFCVAGAALAATATDARAAYYSALAQHALQAAPVSY